MINVFIKRWKLEQQEKKLRELKIKVLELRHYITKCFEEKQITEGGVNIPAWMETKAVMLKLGIDEENPRIVNFYFKRMQQHKLGLI